MRNPIRSSFAIYSCFALCLAVAGPAQEPAQEPADTGSQDLRIAKLKKVLEAMGKLESLTFATKHRDAKPGGNNPLMAIQINAAGGAVARQAAAPKDAVTEGVWAGSLLYHSCNEGKHEVVVRGRSRIARHGEHWQPVAVGKLADGTPAPYLLDPEQLFRVLACQDLKLLRHSVGEFENKPVEIYTLSFVDTAAQQLDLAGIQPPASSGLATARMRIRGIDPPEITDIVDAVFIVDPQQGLRQVKFRTLRFDVMAAVMRTRGLRRGQAEEEEKEEQEDDALKIELDPKKLKFEDGLPVRKIRDFAESSFEVTFKGKGSANLPEFSDRAKKLLGL